MQVYWLGERRWLTTAGGTGKKAREGGGLVKIRRADIFMDLSQQVRNYLYSLFPEMHADPRNRRLLSHTGEVWIRFALLR